MAKNVLGEITVTLTVILESKGMFVNVVLNFPRGVPERSCS